MAPEAAVAGVCSLGAWRPRGRPAVCLQLLTVCSHWLWLPVKLHAQLHVAQLVNSLHTPAMLQLQWHCPHLDDVCHRLHSRVHLVSARGGSLKSCHGQTQEGDLGACAAHPGYLSAACCNNHRELSGIVSGPLNDTSIAVDDDTSLMVLQLLPEPMPAAIPAQIALPLAAVMAEPMKAAWTARLSRFGMLLLLPIDTVLEALL